MASAVHAVALRSKQAKKKKLLQDQLQVQQQLGGRQPSIVGLTGSTGRPGGDPSIRSPRRSHQGWEIGSDHSGYGDGKTANEDHRERSEKAHKKWLKKHQNGYVSPEPIDFSKSYAAAEERGAGPNGTVDVLLWLGLAVLLTGTVISFVGLGEKGFRTSQLRLLGPIMSGTGLAVVVVRIAFCCMGKKAKAAVNGFKLSDQLSKAVRMHHSVAVQAIRYQPVMDESNIPAIHIDPNSDQNGQNAEAVEIQLNEEENEPLITPVTTCTAIIENEGNSMTNSGDTDGANVQRSESANWNQQASQLATELALSPLWLSVTPTSSSNT